MTSEFVKKVRDSLYDERRPGWLLLLPGSGQDAESLSHILRAVPMRGWTLEFTHLAGDFWWALNYGRSWVIAFHLERHLGHKEFLVAEINSGVAESGDESP